MSVRKRQKALRKSEVFERNGRPRQELERTDSERTTAMKTETPKERFPIDQLVRWTLRSSSNEYGCDPVPFTGTEMACTSAIWSSTTSWKCRASAPRDRFEAFARSVRDILSQRWVLTEKTYERKNPKRLYYLSMEFLIGRSLANNVTNLLLDPLAEGCNPAQEPRLDRLAGAGTRCRPG